MNIVIPMAGRGSRFFDNGYAEPKFMLSIENVSLLEFSVNSLPINLATKIIFILLREHQNSWNVIEFIKSKYSSYDLEFIVLDDVTRGQSETVLKAKDLVNNSTELLIYNIDTYFESVTLEENLASKGCDGYIGAFTDNQNKWSFAKVDSSGYVSETAEKVAISNNALTGLYHFSEGSDFVRVAEKAINDNELVKNEFYIAPLYNELIKEGKKFKLDLTSNFVALGTPEDFENAKAKKWSDLNSSKG